MPTHSPFRGAPLVFALAVLAACAKDTPTTPSLAAANAPPTSGPNVIRGPFGPGTISGADEELTVAVGFEEPFAEHCADLESPNQPGSAQLVFTPSGGSHFRQSGQDLNVVVFEFAGLSTDACEDLVGAPVVATGTARLSLASNDLVGGGTGPGADVVSVTLNGVVNLVSGGRARLHVTTVTLLKPDGTFAFDHVRIALRPIGR